MSRQLVVCNRTAGSEALATYARECAAVAPETEFTILVPSDPGFGWKPWDDLQLESGARTTLQRATETFTAAGARVTRGVVGARDPLAAIDDELREGPAYDMVVISTLPPGISRWLKLDLVARARKKLRLPIVHLIGEPVAAEARQPVAAGRAEPETPPAAAPGEPAPELRWVRRYIAEETVGTLPLEPGGAGDAEPDIEAVWRRLHEGRGVANLFGALAASPLVLDAYVRFLNSVWFESGLEPALRELAILRIARAHRYEYLWHQHVAIGRALGIPDERLVAIEHYRSSEHVHFDARERAVLGFVDAFCGSGAGLEEAKDLLARYVSGRTIAALGLLAGFYQMTGKWARAFAVETEEPFVGWDLYG